MGMEMPGQTSVATTAAFLGMWIMMTAAMMLPSLVPMLVRYRRDLEGVSAPRAAVLTMIVTVGYFVVWFAIGMLVSPLTTFVGQLGAAGAGAIVVIALAYQWAPRKARDLACCRQMLVHSCPRDAHARSAWQQGLRYGLQCARCCANLMAIPVVLGTMNLWMMVVVGVVIAGERLCVFVTNRRGQQSYRRQRTRRWEIAPLANKGRPR